MGAIFDALVAIAIWRCISDLKPVNYNKIRQIVKEELHNQRMLRKKDKLEQS